MFRKTVNRHKQYQQRVCIRETVSVRIVMNGKSAEVEASGTIADALRSLDIRPNAYLYLVNGVPIPSDTVLKEGMEITAMRVASGG